MIFHEVQFPPDIAYGASGGPEYLTSVVSMASGYEQRNANWSAARLAKLGHNAVVQAHGLFVAIFQIDEIIRLPVPQVVTNNPLIRIAANKAARTKRGFFMGYLRKLA